MSKRMKGNPVTNILHHIRGKNKKLRNRAVMLYEMNMEVKQIAKQLGVSEAQVNHWLFE